MPPTRRRQRHAPRSRKKLNCSRWLCGPALAKNPQDTLKHLYDFLGEPWFGHDLDNVEYEASEFDLALGTPNLHTVRRKVAWIERRTVLPPELFNRFVNDAFWAVPEININNVPVILHRA